MPMELKLLYVNFIFAEKKKEMEYMEQRANELRSGQGKQQPQEFRFVDPRDYYIDDNEEFINQKQVDGG